MVVPRASPRIWLFCPGRPGLLHGVMHAWAWSDAGRNRPRAVEHRPSYANAWGQSWPRSPQIRRDWPEPWQYRYVRACFDKVRGCWSMFSALADLFLSCLQLLSKSELYGPNSTRNPAPDMQPASGGQCESRRLELSGHSPRGHNIDKPADARAAGHTRLAPRHGRRLHTGRSPVELPEAGIWHIHKLL